jgi:hypothetical protein
MLEQLDTRHHALCDMTNHRDEYIQMGMSIGAELQLKGESEIVGRSEGNCICVCVCLRVQTGLRGGVESERRAGNKNINQESDFIHHHHKDEARSRAGYP